VPQIGHVLLVFTVPAQGPCRHGSTTGPEAGTLSPSARGAADLGSVVRFVLEGFDFARNKPIELLDGSNLLYLLSEHAGIEAKIVPPDDWKDPVADMPEPHT
jgi:hypothetical protein